MRNHSEVGAEGEASARKFFDVSVDDEINVSSTGHYHVMVRYMVRGQGGIYREGRYYWLDNHEFLGIRNGVPIWLGAPDYMVREVNRLIVALITSGKAKFFEYDRDKNKRYDNLRYHDPARVDWLVEMLGKRS